MTNQFKCNSQSIFFFHKQLAHEKTIFKHDKSPFGAVSDPGGGSGDPDPPPKTWRLFETEMLTPTGSYITF